jgi:hypothetical protein
MEKVAPRAPRLKLGFPLRAFKRNSSEIPNGTSPSENYPEIELDLSDAEL